MNSKHFKEDFIAGFLVFLIALPLSLGIAAASGFPPVAGILTAIVGGMLSSWMGSSRLTIKGPAAGLIVIVLAAVQELGGGNRVIGYKKALAACVIAAILQIIVSLLKGASITQIIPSSVIHGMLSGIGAIIIIKQIPILLGAISFKATTLSFFSKFPELLAAVGPKEALIGGVGIVVMFGFGSVAKGFVKKIPVQIIVLMAGVFIAYFESLNPFENPELVKYFVSVPEKTLQLITLPDFSTVFSFVSLKHSLFLFLVASIESLLTVNAIDAIDKEKRNSNLNKDLFSTGIGNLVSALIGGLPMISEIVRSRANLDNGAKSASSNFFHGCFLLLSILLIPTLLDRIPLACLAAMLIYTGTRLASIKEFKHAFQSGRVHFSAFMITFTVTVFSDLLTGVLIGFAFELIASVVAAKGRRTAFKAVTNLEKQEDGVTLYVSHSVNFMNSVWIQKEVESYIQERFPVTIDLSKVSYLDSTSREKFNRLSVQFENLKMVGLNPQAE